VLVVVIPAEYTPPAFHYPIKSSFNILFLVMNARYIDNILSICLYSKKSLLNLKKYDMDNTKKPSKLNRWFTAYTPGKWLTGVWLGIRWVIAFGLVGAVVYGGILTYSGIQNYFADNGKKLPKTKEAGKMSGADTSKTAAPSKTVSLSDTALEKIRIKTLKDSLASVDRLIELRKEALAIESAIKCKLEHLPAIDSGTPPCTHKEPSQKVFVQKKSSPNQRTSGHISKSGPIGPHEVIYQ
jgi:hypothetical protein